MELCRSPVIDFKNIINRSLTNVQKECTKGRIVCSSKDTGTIGWPCVKTKPKQNKTKKLDTDLTATQKLTQKGS